MPISRYDIVVATHPKELNALMADGGYVAIGYICAQPSYGLQAVGEGVIDPWGSVTDYELVQSQFYKDLIPLVNEKIAEGYQPIGGLAHWDNAFVQAVGKVDAGSGSGGGESGGLPTGTQYQIASFNKDTGAMQAAPMNMNRWTGTDLPKYDAAMTFMPLTNFAAGGMSSTQGCVAVDTMPARFAVAQRDMNGCLGVESANQPYQATSLQQVEQMIAASRKAIEDGIIDIINGAIGQRSSPTDK